MAFFKDLESIITNAENVVSETGQKVAQQTKNLTEINQLNMKISQKNKEMNQLYVELGMAYFEKNKNNPQAEGLSNILNILSLRKEIQEFENRIQEIKGVQKCPNCGEEIPAGAKFCPKCGSQIN